MDESDADVARTTTPVGDVPPMLLGMLAQAVRSGSAPRGGVVRLRLIDGERDGSVAVDVEEAREALGLNRPALPR